MISLLYLGVQRSRDAMTFGASKTEALDGSPVPLGSTATHETTGSKLCGSRSKATQNKRIPATINNHRRDKR
ncbi:MAG: hypothetical protein RQ855_00415 [Desulfurococcales archaeon]|nr:hypothetical protein [Desulfurococcales archaeon]